MSFHDERESRRRRRAGSDSGTDADIAKPPRKKRPPPNEIGSALRSAYQRMVDEDIPPEMLDLLGKLG